MRQVTPKEEPRPPGVIATLTAGFELTTGHLWLIVLPILLDVFFWLGPRLSVQRLIEQSAEILGAEPAFEQLVEQMPQVASQVNLFTSLSLPLIGIPALMSGAVPEITPVVTSVFQVDGALLWFILFVSLNLAGLVFAALYLGLIGRTMHVENDAEQKRSNFAVSIIINSVRLLGLGLLFLALLIAISLPLLPVAFVLGFLSTSLSLLVLMLGFVVVAVFLSLAVPGIILKGRPVLAASLESIRLVRLNMAATFNLLLLIVLISYGMNFLWHLADDGSWLTLISITGHAFISTALAVALFIFYRDRAPTAAEPIEEGVVQ